MERWIAVLDYEELYEVSDLGRVRRKPGTPKCIRGRLLNLVPLKKRGGYLMVSLWKEGRGLPHRVHRLVYESFHRTRLESTIDVHHRNGDRQDNRLDNLEAIHESLHPAARVHKKRRGEESPNSLFTNEQVREIRALYRKGQSGYGYRAIGDLYGVRSEYIRDIIKGKTWAHLQ